LLVNVDGNPAPVVRDRRRGFVLVYGHGDAIRVAVDRFVDRVVDDLPEKAVETRGIGTADVHARTLPHRLEAFEDRDIGGGVPGFCHEKSASAYGCSLISLRTPEIRSILTLPGVPRSGRASGLLDPCRRACL